MMDVYFCFSDDAGSYERNRTSRFVRAHPYFIRSAVLLKASDWIWMRDKYKKLYSVYPLPAGKELKWSYIWSIIQHRRRGEEIPPGKPYSPFAHLSEEQLLDFVRDSLKLLSKVDHCCVIYTVTDNGLPSTGQISKKNIYRMHIQDLMQKVEYELEPLSGLAVVFLDPMGDSTADRIIRDAYADFYKGDTFVAEYRHIKDSLAYEFSHQSFGIRLADYAAGIFNGLLRGFSISTEFFKELIWPVLRKDSTKGDPFGYGIIEVPKRESVRHKIRQIVKDAMGLEFD